ncbi:MAG: hypothetical protein JWP61_2893 [Friedmanniella sp.]|nr:hypothetical protein [Friedmanniella sp.]
MVHVASGGLGERLGGHRRNRIAYLALLRRSGDYTLRSVTSRSAATAAVLVLAVFSRNALPAAALCLLAVASCYLLAANEWHHRRGSEPRFWPSVVYLRNGIRTDGVHTLSLGSYLEIPAGLMLLVVPSWVTVDEPVAARVAMLGAGTIFLISASVSILNDHTWYNPAERPPAWHEILRLGCGPIVCGMVAAVSLPATWGPEGRLAVWVICLTPISQFVRISDTDLIVRHLAPLVREESHAGRELVISETHGALSTNLRLLEQQARPLRNVAPSLYELAVSANSRLRETLTLAHIDADSSISLQSLEAPVLTLARAVGAKAEVTVTMTTLSGADHDLCHLVLNDLVGNALNAGAGAIKVNISGSGPDIRVSVTDDAPPMVRGVWKTPGTSSARLAGRLAGLRGSLTLHQDLHDKTVTARWTATDFLP